jgi:hypothetical protein
MDPLSTPTSRRVFAKSAAAAAALPLLAPLAGCAPALPVAPPADAPAPAGAPAAGAAAQAEAEALTALLRSRYGSRLTEEQWAEVREGIVGNLRAAEQLRRFPLGIEVEPALGWAPYRGEGR